jgi:hypothetical protein
MSTIGVMITIIHKKKLAKLPKFNEKKIVTFLLKFVLCVRESEK